MPRKKHRMSWIYEGTPPEEDTLAASPVEVAYLYPADNITAEDPSVEFHEPEEMKGEPVLEVELPHEPEFETGLEHEIVEEVLLKATSEAEEPLPQQRPIADHSLNEEAKVSRIEHKGKGLHC